MARIALISCNMAQEPYPVYPLGLSIIAEAARASGHTVFEWDLLMHKGSLSGAAGFIQSHQPDYIGLSLRNIDTVNYNEQKSYVHGYRKMVDTIRQVSPAPIILGGSAFTILPEAILQATGADYGITGEGEIAFCDLINVLENGSTPAGKILPPRPRLSGKQMGIAPRNNHFADFYLKKGGMLNVQTKRGCPHLCAYCSYPTLEGRLYRQRPAEEVADEVEMLIKEHHADYYAVTDSVFNDSTGHYLEIAEALVRRNIATPWMCFLRPDYFTADEVDLLKRAGLSSIEWGTDCSTDQTLRAMKKDFSWDQVVHANNLFAKAGIANAHFIIFGGPAETEQTVLQGLENINHLENCVVFASLGVRIFPHTAMYERALQENVITRETDLLEPVFYFSKDIRAAWIHEALLKSFAGREDRIYPDGQLLDKTSAFHLLGYRGPVWDYILKKGPTRRKKHVRQG